MAIAVGVSWYVASEVFGHTNTYFAPIAAAVVLRVAPGQRTKRAVEMVAGITVGIAVGDLVVREIGVGGWQIALIVTMAVSVAILLGAGNLIASQAAATAVLVASLPSPDASYTRFTDALIGGCVGLTVLIAVPRSPLTPLRRLVDPFLAQCADALAQSADALARRDADAASRALHDAYDIGRLGHSYSRELQQSQETALLSPVRRHELSEVDRYIDATPHIDGLARDTRVLCRAVRGAIETDASVPNELPDAIRELAAAVAELPELLSRRPAVMKASRCRERSAPPHPPGKRLASRASSRSSRSSARFARPPSTCYVRSALTGPRRTRTYERSAVERWA